VRKRRTLIITLISIFHILAGGIGILFCSFGSLTQKNVNTMSAKYGLLAYIAREFGETELRAALAAWCLVLFMIGIGLWRMMPWARTAMITISILTICSGAENLLEYRLDQHIEKSLDFTDVLLVCFFLYYFSRSKIKDRFLNVRSAMTAPNAN
jgi:hypothetical protein